MWSIGLVQYRLYCYFWLGFAVQPSFFRIVALGAIYRPMRGTMRLHNTLRTSLQLRAIRGFSGAAYRMETGSSGALTSSMPK